MAFLNVAEWNVQAVVDWLKGKNTYFDISKMSLGYHLKIAQLFVYAATLVACQLRALACLIFVALPNLPLSFSRDLAFTNQLSLWLYLVFVFSSPHRAFIVFSCRDLGLDDSILPYVPFFMNNNVNGCRLLLLSSDDLEKLNVHKIGHQEIILEGVDLLRYDDDNMLLCTHLQ